MAIKKKDTRTKLAFGDLNQIEKPNTGVSYDASDTTVMGTMQTMLDNQYKNKGFQNTGPLKGVVLRVELGSDKNASSIWSSLPGFKTVPLKELKVRIPEIHAALPEPAVYGDTPGPHQRVIDLYPTFVARDEEASKGEIVPGDIVIVDYADKNNLTQPIFIRKVTQGPGASGEKSKNGINQTGQSSEGSEAFNNSSGNGGYCSAGATAAGNGKILPSTDGASKLERAQNVVAMVQSQTGVALSVRLLYSFMEVESLGTPTKTTVRFEPHVFLGMKGPYWRTGDKGTRPGLYGGANYSGNDKVPYSPRGINRPSWAKDSRNKRKSLRGRDYAIDSKRGNTNRRAFDRAFKLDPVQAIKSTSWGSYQVMGWALLRAYDNDPQKAVAAYDSNPAAAGDMMIAAWFKDAFRFSEKKQAFTKTPPNFEAMVSVYNGSSQVRSYAPKLQSAYNKFGDIAEPPSSTPTPQPSTPTATTEQSSCGRPDWTTSGSDKSSARSAEWSDNAARWPQDKKLRSMDPRMVPKVEAVLAALTQRGFKPKIFYAWRSREVQAELVRKGNSKVLFSFHNAEKDGAPNAYAADIVDSRWGWEPAAKEAGFWKALGEEAKKAGLYWGGDWRNFPDVAHVQLYPNNRLASVKKESNYGVA